MKIDKNTILKDKLFIDFVTSRNLQPITVKSYSERLKLYCQYYNQTPTELIEEAENEEKDPEIKKRDRKLKKKLIEYSQHLIKSGKSKHYIKSSMTTIKTFYNEYEIEMPQGRLRLNHADEKRQTIDNVPTKKHIKKMLKYSNLKFKGILLLMASSGMGSAEVRHLRYFDFINAISEDLEIDDVYNIPKINEKIKETENLIGTWKIQRYKTKMPYITFSTFESLSAIADYLEARHNKKPIEDMDEWLFTTKERPILRNSFMKYIQVTNDKASLGFDGRHRFFTAHKLRKFFASTLYSKGLPQLTIDWMLGHSIDDTTEAYFKSQVSSLRQAYFKVIPDLSIEPIEVRIINNEETENMLNEMNKELAELKEFKDIIMSDPVIQKRLEWKMRE